MIISLISEVLVPTKHKRIHYGLPFICLKDINKEYSVNTNLIIVPNKLITQWANYFKNCVNLNILKISTKKDLKKINNISDYDVILCSDLRYKFFYESYNNIKWSRIIIDEVDTIRLPSIISWNANFIWLITSFPDKLLFSNKNFIVIKILFCLVYVI